MIGRQHAVVGCANMLLLLLLVLLADCSQLAVADGQLTWVDGRHRVDVDLHPGKAETAAATAA